MEPTLFAVAAERVQMPPELIGDSSQAANTPSATDHGSERNTRVPIFPLGPALRSGNQRFSGSRQTRFTRRPCA